MKTEKLKFLSPVFTVERISLDMSFMTTSVGGISSGDINIDELEGRYIDES